METEKIKLTNTAEVKLYKIPRERWGEMKKLFLANDYLSLITHWNNYGVSPERICPGCPWGVKLVHPHIELLVKKYEMEDEPKENTRVVQEEVQENTRAIEEEPQQEGKPLDAIEDLLFKKKKKGGKDKSEQNDSGEENQGPYNLGAEDIV